MPGIITTMSYKPNFQEIVQDVLKGTEFTQQALARELGVTQTYICRTAQGLAAEPRYSVGAHLIEIHRRVVKRRRAA